ncbi:serine/threonine-protein kinase [Ideonella livida]|uniref:Serine/threonine protein kinase n=1 Tax=Ideonella livida TaxID=2707176 RepID=A0A7C9PFQ2_9BURK|nr:serine/threonine-protein kinase [Ideonella livida]NDY90776.1 serine/threonine protein kinase [Ideonella livida]
MRWNPFRKNAGIATPEQNAGFEATVIEDVPRSAFDPGVTLAAIAAEHTAQETASKSPAIGQIGRFVLRSVLGQGGLGTVYNAWDPLLSRSVAVKTLRVAGDAEAQHSAEELLLNEARASARLSHQHIVTVFDAGLSDQGVYIAMEPLRGVDLRKLLQQGWRPTAIEIAQLVRRVADALAYAHGKGVVHCDVKPANIFMVDRKSPKVLDFGIARLAHRDGTAPGGPTAGSPYYLAPEQIRGESIDRRADVYSLGVVLFELLTTKVPYTGDSLDDILNAVLHAPVPQARKLNPQVPSGLSTIAAKAMSRAPDDRYPSARHLANDLREWLMSSEARALSRTPEEQRRKVLTLTAVVLTAIAAAAGWQSWQRSQPSAPVLTAAPAAAPVVAPVAPVAAPSLPASAASATSADPAPVATPAPAAVTTPPPAATPTPTAVRPAPAPRTGATPMAGRESREPPAIQAVPPPTVAVAPAPSHGTVQLAITPWGQVEIDGSPVGTAPPLSKLNLTVGQHTITIRNADFPPVTRLVEVEGDKTVVVKHKFGN